MVVLILKCIRIAGVVGFPKGWFFRTFPRDEISCMCSDRKLGFNWGRILDHVVLVDFEVDLLALVKIKPLFDNLAHGNDRLLVNGFCQPEWNFVTFSSDIYYGTIHNVSEFTKCFTWKVMGEILHYCIKKSLLCNLPIKHIMISSQKSSKYCPRYLLSTEMSHLPPSLLRGSSHMGLMPCLNSE